MLERLAPVLLCCGDAGFIRIQWHFHNKRSGELGLTLLRSGFAKSLAKHCDAS